MARALALALAAPVWPAWADTPGRPPAGRVSLPALGDSASADLSVSDERRLGLDIMRSVYGDPLYLDDPMLLDYVQSLWAPLVASARRLGHIGPDIDEAFGWEVFLVRDSAVNAFALPGGHVGVYLGLIALTQTRDELASVLAHELSHVTQRHIARSIGSAQRVGMASTAAMLLALLAASQTGNADVAQAAIAGGQAAMVQGQLNFSRDMEREADRVGFSSFESAGYAPRGMASMFERLALANRISDSEAYPYLRSHPLTTERIADARSRLPAASTEGPGGSAMHALMRARARVLMAPGSAEWQSLSSEGTSATDDPAVLAGHARRALAAARLRDIDRAGREAAALRRAAAAPGIDAATQQAAERIAAEVWLSIEDADAAADALARADAAQGRTGLLLQAQLVGLRARRAPGPASVADARRSVEALQVWTAEHPADALAWQALAAGARAAGLPLRALRAEAEARAARGDVAGAVDGLRAARRQGAQQPAQADGIELQAIEARLRTLQETLDALRAQANARR